MYNDYERHGSPSTSCWPPSLAYSQESHVRRSTVLRTFCQMPSLLLVAISPPWARGLTCDTPKDPFTRGPHLSSVSASLNPSHTQHHYHNGTSPPWRQRRIPVKLQMCPAFSSKFTLYSMLHDPPADHDAACTSTANGQTYPLSPPQRPSKFTGALSVPRMLLCVTLATRTSDSRDQAQSTGRRLRKWWMLCYDTTTACRLHGWKSHTSFQLGLAASTEFAREVRMPRNSSSRPERYAIGLHQTSDNIERSINHAAV